MMRRQYRALIIAVAAACSLWGCKAGGGSESAGAGAPQTSGATASETDSPKETGLEPVAAKAGAEGMVTFTDGLGFEVSVKKSDRAAVLSGSFAGCWLLAGGKLEAVTEDSYMEDGLEIPEEAVNLGALTSPNMEELIASGTEFVILSANFEQHVALRDTLEKAGITTAYFDVETFDDYLDMLKICTDITGREDLYQENGLDIQKTVKEQIARADGSNPRVLFLRAFSTGVRAKGSKNNMMGKMLKDLGCVNIADDDKSLLDDLSMESIIAQDPDYIFVTTMGVSEEAAMKSVEEMLTLNPAWSELTAVKNDRYYVLPKVLFHNKPNNRWGESYTILADILYGEDQE